MTGEFDKHLSFLSTSANDVCSCHRGVYHTMILFFRIVSCIVYALVVEDFSRGRIWNFRRTTSWAN